MRRISWAGFVLCLLVTLPVVAQQFTSTMQGVVTDPSGASVSGATVTAKNSATGEERTATTSNSGSYAITNLAPGLYEVHIQQANFKEYVSSVQLFVSSTTTLNAALQVGSASDQVTVEANALQVETSTGAVGNVVEGNQVRELPLNGRSFAQLTQLMPGVSPASNFDSKHKGLEAGVDFSVNGNNTTGNLFLVDGVNNNDIGSQRTILIYPSIDAIQEFKILRNSYPPEYGQAMGAIISIVTKGGTNQFHGSGYYFGRNDALNATDYFNNLNGSPKDVLRRNDYGYDVGGPVIKDKLFFFWSQEWNHEKRGKLRSANVPTVAEKSGDFSAQLAPTPLRPSSCDAAPTLGPTVPSISPTGSLLVQLFPDPNVAPSAEVNCQNWVQSLTSPIYWREENVRMDYQLGKTWSLFGRFTQDHWNQPSPSTLGYWGDDRYPSVDPNWTQPGYQATIKLTKLLGSTAVNDFQLSYAANRITVTAGGTNPGLVQQINASYQTYFPTSDKLLGNQVGYPVFWGGAGDGNVGTSDTLWNMGPWHNNEELYIAKDDFSKVHGAHTFKVGFLASNNRKNEVSGGTSGEAPNYWGATSNDSGNGVFNMLNNNVAWGFGESQTNPFAETRWHDYEMYYGDSWKIRRNVTLEYGARWSFLRNPFSRTNKIASWQPNLYDPALGGGACNGLLLVPGTDPCTALGFAGTGGVAGPNRSLKANNNHEIAPRLGIAWDVKGDGKTAIRAGLGEFYQRDRISNYLYIATNSPFSVSAGGTRPLTGSVPAGSLTSSASPSWGLDPTDSVPKTWQWNLTVERQLYRDSKLEIAYVGNRGENILQYKDANAVLPGQRLAFAIDNTNAERFATSFGEIKYGEWTAHSNYNALQALYRTRFKALDAQFAYTWSKSLANTDITNSGNTSNTATVTDIANPNRDYGPTTINRPNVFVSNIVYTFPVLDGHSAPMRFILGGWEAGGILTYANGPSQTIFGLNGGANVDAAANTDPLAGPVHPTWQASGGLQGTGDNENQKPNQILADCRAHGGPKYQWFNPAAFTLDNYQIGSFGNEHVGACSGPGIANTDFSAYKNFKVSERVNVQFRMEFFNLFNKTQFRADQINLQLAGNAIACVNANPDPACAGRAPNTAAWSFASNGQGNFGQAGSNGSPGDRGPREIQYALKIIF
jgi:hypothetical protein